MTGRIFREIIPPLLTLYLFFLVMLASWVRRRPERPRRDRRVGGPPPRYWAATMIAGYGFFLAIVFVFMDRATGDRTAMHDAFVGGSALLFGIVVPAFVVLSAAEGWLRRRRSR